MPWRYIIVSSKLPDRNHYLFIRKLSGMSFNIQIQSNIPLTSVEDLEEVLVNFLHDIGYISEGYSAPEAGQELVDSVPVGIFMHCFFPDPERVWLVEEMSVLLNAHKTTVYRHLTKLKNLDLVEEAVREEEDGRRKKGYRIRYGNIKKAWSFTETNVEVAMRNYAKTVEHLQQLVEEHEWDQ